MRRRASFRSGAVSIMVATALLFSGCSSTTSRSVVSPAQDKRTLTSFSQEITSPLHQFTMKAGAAYSLGINVKNTGSETWLRGNDTFFVDAGYRWHDTNGSVLLFEGTRGLLTRLEVGPGQSDDLKIEVLAQPKPGSYTLWVSMVQEGVSWFFDRGANPLVLQVTIQ